MSVCGAWPIGWPSPFDYVRCSVAALQENDLANRRPPMPILITTLGGTIAAVYSRCQSQRNYEFAMHRRLVVNAAEAITVKLIFERYLDLGCVRAVSATRCLLRPKYPRTNALAI
jgi:hypothetical protein